MFVRKSHLTVKASAIRQAIERAKMIDSNWQAAICELAMVPDIAAFYQQVNRDNNVWRLPVIERFEGRPYAEGMGRNPDGSLRKVEWENLGGWRLKFVDHAGNDLITVWNSRSRGYCDGYSHSASTTYDGMRRETYCAWLRLCVDIYFGKYGEWQKFDTSIMVADLAEYGVTFLDDMC